MQTNLNHILIETTVRKTLKQIKDDPERIFRGFLTYSLLSMRNITSAFVHFMILNPHIPRQHT